MAEVNTIGGRWCDTVQARSRYETANASISHVRQLIWNLGPAYPFNDRFNDNDSSRL